MLESRCRVHHSCYAAPRPPHTRTRSSAAAVGFRSAIIGHGGHYLRRRTSKLVVFDDQSTAPLLPQCWDRRASLEAADDCRRERRSRRKIVLTEDERAHGTRQPGSIAARVTDAADWLRRRFDEPVNMIAVEPLMLLFH